MRTRCVKQGSSDHISETKGSFPRIIVAGGGTGGHLFPGIAIAREFIAEHPGGSVLFVSTGNPFERATLAREGFELAAVSTEGIKGRGIWRQIRAVGKIPVGVFQALKIVRRYRPDLVLGVGSYASAPVVMGAWLSGVPVVLHEQNRIPGVTNRMLARLADRVYVSFDVTGRFFGPAKTRLTGNPVRREILETDRSGDTKAPFTVLIVGGSQGAHGINGAVTEAVRCLTNRKDFFFIHQTGPKDAASVARAYADAGCPGEVRPFFGDMAEQYRRAHMVICRAGATTVAEVTALGKAVLFIPFPHAADNHQVHNARSLSDAGAAETLEESELSGRRLAERIEYYSAHPEALQRMGAAARRFGRPSAGIDIVRDFSRLLGLKP